MHLKKVLLSSSLLLGFTAIAFGASAQDKSADAKKDKPKAKDASEVVVVGSRIRKDVFNSASPIQVITRDEATAAGLTSTAEVLQSTAVTNGGAQINNAYGNFVINGGPGVNTVGLRGLGPGRTLVTLNGRRVSPAGSRGSIGSADLNVLPNALIGRIDVLKDGASAIYGSDAIGGVINIVTRKINGVVAEVQSNTAAHGGGDQYRASIAAGKTFGRLSLIGSAEYYEQTNLALKDRSWTQCNTDYYWDPVTKGSLDFIDPLTGKPKCYPITTTGSNGVTINTLGTGTITGVGAAGSVGTSFNRWRPNSSVTTGLAGFEGVGGGSNNINVRDTFDPRTLNQSLISPSKTATFFGQANYDLPEMWNSHAYAELLVNRRNSEQTGYRQLTLDYIAGNPLISAGLAAVAGNAAGPGSSLITTTGAYKYRAFIGFGNYHSNQDNKFIKITTGLKGDFGLLDGWTYDTSFTYSKSDAKYTTQSWLTDRVKASLDAAPAVAGVPASLVRNGLTCSSNNAAPGTGNCVVAPALTTATISGVLPQDWINYTFVPVVGKTIYDEATFTAGISGPIVNLPAGPVQGAFGVELRREGINDTPDPNSVAGNLYNLSGSGITRGADTVKEAYAELAIPVLKDVPGFKNLAFEAAGRYTEYHTYGSSKTYKLGGVWDVADFLTVRASKGTSFRAPALFEQFLGSTTGFTSSSGDPCNNWNAAGVSSVRVTNCQAAGVPANFNQLSSITVVTSGGAANHLSAETSINQSYGWVVHSSFLPKDVFGDLAISGDHFDINIKNGIQSLSGSTILSLCYDDPRTIASNPYCSYVTRNPATFALTVKAGYTNVSRNVTQGWDYNLRWSRKFGDVGVLVNLAKTHFTKQAVATLTTSPLTDYNGTLQTPKDSGQFNTTVSWREYKLRYGVDYVGKMSSMALYGLDPATSKYTLFTPDYYTQNASLQYTGKTLVMTLGVRNLADKVPPSVSSGAVNRVGNALLYSGYDYVGRQIFMNVSKKF